MNSLKDKFRNDELTLGTWISVQHPDIVEMLSSLPFDWLMFDMEHSPATIQSLQKMLPALDGTDITPFVRVPWNDIVHIKRVLDIGFEGVLVPYVNTKKEAEKAVKACRYPPEGLRGVGPRRACMYGKQDVKDYFDNFEKEDLIVGIQIETSTALDNVDEILSVEGIDLALVGPMDLSANLGVFGDYDHPKFKEAIDKVLTACEKEDITPGAFATDVDQMKKQIEKGFRFVSIGLDYSVLLDAYSKILNTLR
ncbi:MAG: HpcH/HpaI aldolase family protein [Candidatus Natronoplasma sp.]